MRARLHLCGLIAAPALVAACGTGAQQRLITRMDYEKAISFAQNNEPIDLEELVRMYPALDGRVITAAEYIEEYDRHLQQARAEGRPVVPWTVSPGTTLSIALGDEPERSYYIGPTGWLDLPLVGKIQMAGRTVEDIKEEMERRLSRVLRRPVVRINVTGARETIQSPFGLGVGGVVPGGDAITVMGVVSSRAFMHLIPFTGSQTLINVLGFTGLTPDAEWRAIRIIRRAEVDPLRQSRIIFCDLWAYFAEGDVRQDIPLMPGDVVFVPRRWSLGEQFQKDWSLILGYMGGLLSLNEFRLAFKKEHGDADGAFRR